MPRPRTTGIAQRQSPRGPPLRTSSSSDSDSLHVRPRTEKSPKLAEGRSMQGAQSNPSNQKKLGTRIADLESQLGLAQEELKSLKNQLVSTEADKEAAQDQLEKKSKKQQKGPEALEIQEKHSTTPIEAQTLNKKDENIAHETSDDAQEETDVFEVPVEKVTVEPKAEIKLLDELAMKNDEINLLKTKLDEKEKELYHFRQENERLKSQLGEKSLKISSAQSEIDELVLKLNKVGQELDESKNCAVQINEKLEVAEKAKEELENEMKRLHIQTEQWRKAADAAASVLAGGVDMNGRRISERCGSMDKHYANAFEPVGGFVGYVGSPGLIDDSDDVFGGEKRKVSGIRMFGDLWKKKGQK